MPMTADARNEKYCFPPIVIWNNLTIYLEGKCSRNSGHVPYVYANITITAMWMKALYDVFI